MHSTMMLIQQKKPILHRQRLGGKPYFKEWEMLGILWAMVTCNR
jgi:hypothetical protein